MRIDFYGDLTCPWCHLGWRRLTVALQQRGVPHKDLSWRPYQLNPDLPVSGVDRIEYLLGKFTTSERVRDVLQTVETAMRLDGLHVNLQSIRIMSNTYLAHRLMVLAAPLGKTDALLQELFVAFFVQGKDIGDPRVLTDVATLARLPHAEVERELTSHTPHPDITRSEQEAKRQNIRAVPYILFDEKYSIAGAHDAVAFLPLIELCQLSASASKE